MPLFSRGVGLARTHRAHCAPEGSFAAGGRVRKKAGAAVAAALGPNAAAAARLARGDVDEDPERDVAGLVFFRNAAVSGPCVPGPAGLVLLAGPLLASALPRLA
jgi:hypothetical protein